MMNHLLQKIMDGQEEILFNCRLTSSGGSLKQLSNYQLSPAKKSMAQEPFPLPFKVQKEHKGIFITSIYKHLFPQQKQKSRSKLLLS